MSMSSRAFKKSRKNAVARSDNLESRARVIDESIRCSWPAIGFSVLYLLRQQHAPAPSRVPRRRGAGFGLHRRRVRRGKLRRYMLVRDLMPNSRPVRRGLDCPWRVTTSYRTAEPRLVLCFAHVTTSVESEDLLVVAPVAEQQLLEVPVGEVLAVLPVGVEEPVRGLAALSRNTIVSKKLLLLNTDPRSGGM